MAKKIHDTHTWGRKTAESRYPGGADFERPPDMSQPEFQIEKTEGNYSNEVPLNGWLRGKDATKKPGFVKTSFKR